MQNGVWNDLAASVIFCEGRSAEGGEVLDDKGRSLCVQRRTAVELIHAASGGVSMTAA